ARVAGVAKVVSYRSGCSRVRNDCPFLSSRAHRQAGAYGLPGPTSICWRRSRYQIMANAVFSNRADGQPYNPSFGSEHLRAFDSRKYLCTCRPIFHPLAEALRTDHEGGTASLDMARRGTGGHGGGGGVFYIHWGRGD